MDPPLPAVLATLGADVHAWAQNGGTALHAAAAKGQAETVRTLVKLGANIHTRAQNGGSPLHAAAAKGQVGLPSPRLELPNRLRLRVLF